MHDPVSKVWNYINFLLLRQKLYLSRVHFNTQKLSKLKQYSGNKTHEVIIVIVGVREA